MATLTTGFFGMDIDQIDLGVLLEFEIIQATPSLYMLELDGERITFFGTGFVYDASWTPVGGTVTSVLVSYDGALVYELDDLNVAATDIVAWASSGDNATAIRTVLAGSDELNGNTLGDLIRGWGGNDTITGFEGADQLYGGDGNDYVRGGPGANFLRGEQGDDWITGGADTDDAHGNMGNDTVEGGAGDDWVVGGQDQDRLYGQDGSDVVLGNLGYDTIEGGAGDDVVRGGKEDDVVNGQAGTDWVSGDRGNDTLTGGLGADNFHVFDGSGVDRVTDFNAAEGDRVWLLSGTQWIAAQVGADTVVTVTGAEGGQLILVGVQLSGLQTGWIFGS